MLPQKSLSNFWWHGKLYKLIQVYISIKPKILERKVTSGLITTKNFCLISVNHIKLLAVIVIVKRNFFK